MLRIFQSTIPIQVSTKSNIYGPYLFRFQSTIPIQVSTFARALKSLLLAISIHDTHTGIDPPSVASRKRATISIHDTHTGIDVSLATYKPVSEYFNPRYPYRYRQNVNNPQLQYTNISIHDTHTGIDLQSVLQR